MAHSIVDAVAGRAAIVVDGGFTRGTAVLKGLALGATVVAVGRTVLWGLAADGADGAAFALDILRRELRTDAGGYGATPTNPSPGISRFAIGSTARKTLSRATAPRRAGPSGAMKHGVVTSWLPMLLVNPAACVTGASGFGHTAAVPVGTGTAAAPSIRRP